MQVKNLSWMIVFILSISLVSALNITSPLNNTIINYNTTYNFSKANTTTNNYFNIYLNNTLINTLYDYINTNYGTFAPQTSTIGGQLYLNSNVSINARASNTTITWTGFRNSPCGSSTYFYVYYNDSTSTSASASYGGGILNACDQVSSITVNVNKIIKYIETWGSATCGSGGISVGVCNYVIQLENTSLNKSINIFNLYNYNLSTGNYNLNVSSFNFTNSLLESKIINVSLGNDSLLNVSVTRGGVPQVANVTLNGYYLCVSSNCLYDVRRGYTYNVTINNVSYSLYSSLTTISNVPLTNLIVELQSNNALNISIFKESDGSLLYGNTSVSFLNLNTGSITYSSLNQSALFSNFINGSYTSTFTLTNYSSRRYNVFIPDRSYNYLKVYLNNGTTVAFNFKSNTGNTLSGVLFNVYTAVNGTNTLVESGISDVTGTLQTSLMPNQYYSFIASLSGYDNYTFFLNPVLFSSYDVILTPSAFTSSYVPSCIVTYSPISYFNYQNVNFNIKFVSQYGSLASYGYNVSYPFTVQNNTGTNSHGQNFNNTFTLLYANSTSVVTLSYWYNLSNGIYFNRTISFPIVLTTSNRTWATMGNSINVSTGQDSVTGYYLGERVFIVVFISIILFGVGWSIGGAVSGLILALVPILFFINVGFVPKQLYYVTLFFTVIYLISRGSDS